MFSSSSKQIRRWTSSKNPTDEFELTPLIESMVTKPAVPRIRRIPTNMFKEEPADDESNELNREASNNRGVKKMENSIPRFGPMYMVDQPSVQATKEKAWDHVLKKSLENIDDDDEGVIKEIYLTAIRRVEKQAKEAYNNDKAAVAGVAGSTFRWMMIRDGCFFLQLVFVILGCSEYLGYAPNDPIFGTRRKNRDQFKKWIESMFYVGNQVPLVVLEELMTQKFFQDVIAAAAAKGGLMGSGPPPGLSKKVLYDVIVLPALQKQGGHQKQKTTSDLLHGFHNLVMGPPSSPTRRQYDRNINIDLEANYEDDDEIEEYEEGGDDRNNKRRIFFPCATELEQSGISFTKLGSGMGARSIRFKSWYMNMWASICLPVFPIDGNTETEMLLRSLKTYEACNQQLSGKDGRDVESYLKFMSDIVQTAKDAQLLIKRGIIADIRDVEKLPRILRRLSSSEQEVRLTHEFNRLRRQIRDYSSPWANIKNFMNIVLLLTLIQTVFALLSYFRPPKP